jgi:histidinol-phosphatase (PHP family)
VEAAIRKGFIAYGFSEHMPSPNQTGYPGFPDYLTGCRMFEGYVRAISDLRDRYRDDINILVGVECEYLPDTVPEMLSFLSSYPFDYIVGSVHNVANMEIDWTPEKWHDLARHCGGVEALVDAYYHDVRGLLDLDVAHLLGHLDLVTIFAPDPDMPVRDSEIETLEKARGKGIPVEVNTRGLIKPCKHVYPRPALLREANRLGVTITLGDDSHSPAQVGLGYEQGLAEIVSAGYTSFRGLFAARDGVEWRDLPIVNETR